MRANLLAEDVVVDNHVDLNSCCLCLEERMGKATSQAGMRVECFCANNINVKLGGGLKRHTQPQLELPLPRLAELLG